MEIENTHGSGRIPDYWNYSSAIGTIPRRLVQKFSFFFELKLAFSRTATFFLKKVHLTVETSKKFLLQKFSMKIRKFAKEFSKFSKHYRDIIHSNIQLFPCRILECQLPNSKILFLLYSQFQMTFEKDEFYSELILQKSFKYFFMITLTKINKFLL